MVDWDGVELIFVLVDLDDVLFIECDVFKFDDVEDIFLRMFNVFG